VSPAIAIFLRPRNICRSEAAPAMERGGARLKIAAQCGSRAGVCWLAARSAREYPPAAPVPHRLHPVTVSKPYCAPDGCSGCTSAPPAREGSREGAGRRWQAAREAVSRQVAAAARARSAGAAAGHVSEEAPLHSSTPLQPREQATPLQPMPLQPRARDSTVFTPKPQARNRQTVHVSIPKANSYMAAI